MSSFCRILASLTFMMSSDAFNLKVFPAGDRCTLKVALSNVWTHPAAFNDFKDFGISSFDFRRRSLTAAASASTLQETETLPVRTDSS